MAARRSAPRTGAPTVGGRHRSGASPSDTVDVRSPLVQVASAVGNRALGRLLGELDVDRPVTGEGHGGEHVRRQLAPGAYVTTKKANVRRDDAKHTAFAELAKGAAVTVIANGGRTSNFRAGLKKNEHSWADRGVEENGWLEDGKLRAAPAASAVDAEPSPASDRLLAPPAPVRSNRGERRRIPTTAPIAIPSSRRGGGSPPREQRATSATPPAFFQTAARREPPPALARSLKVFVHMTSGNYRDDIEREGLVAGKGRGIGLPDEAGKQGPVDPHHLYVLSGSNAETSRFVSMESGRQPIVIVSRTEASDRDVNYPKGGAYRFDREIAPLAGRPEADGPGTVSFPLPITGSSRQVLAQFLNEMLSPDDQVDADAATEIVETMILAQEGFAFLALVSGQMNLLGNK